MPKTITDPIKAVAEAKCAEVIRLGREHIPGDTCYPCVKFNGGNGSMSGTGLRWPTLSRECGHRPWLGATLHNPDCESGRIPDVTLEKVLEAIAVEVGSLLQFSREHTDPDKGQFICNAGDTYQLVGQYAYTRLEAACSALLATSSPEVSPQEPRQPLG